MSSKTALLFRGSTINTHSANFQPEQQTNTIDIYIFIQELPRRPFETEIQQWRENLACFIMEGGFLLQESSM
jgi:hypothetical protein